jgi:hypothetical protein
VLEVGLPVVLVALATTPVLAAGAVVAEPSAAGGPATVTLDPTSSVMAPFATVSSGCIITAPVRA